MNTDMLKKNELEDKDSIFPQTDPGNGKQPHPPFLNCNYYFPTILQTTKRCGQTEAETQ